MKKLFGHFMTISKHKGIVMWLCFRCGYYKQGLLHDLSKYSFSEFITGVRYFQGNRSPNGVDKMLHGYSAAWLHHKGRNKHHWEYWTDVSKGQFVPLQMPVNYVIEMYCDRVAATKTYLKKDYTKESPLEYYQRNYNHVIMDDKSRALIELILKHMAKHGLDETIRFIKSDIKTKGYEILRD